MIHQPQNQCETKDETLKAKAGDTFRCGCSTLSKDSDGKVYSLNSWKLREDGWYHFGSTNGIPLEEDFHMHSKDELKKDWIKICGKTSEPYDTLPEVVNFD
jgi:hypothetical protein